MKLTQGFVECCYGGCDRAARYPVDGIYDDDGRDFPVCTWHYLVLTLMKLHAQEEGFEVAIQRAYEVVCAAAQEQEEQGVVQDIRDGITENPVLNYMTPVEWEAYVRGEEEGAKPN